MEPPPLSSVHEEFAQRTPLRLASLFEVEVHASGGEVDESSINELSPLRPGEIPETYHRWVAKRQREFRAGRHHARKALALAGERDALVRRGDDGLPLFPEGYFGCITHTGREVTYAASAVCSPAYCLGIDAENHKRLSHDMVDAILLPHEQRRFHQVTSRQSGAPQEIGMFALWVFSMKEAYYKCVYPKCAAQFGFLDVDVTVNPSDQSFCAELCTDRYPDVPRQLSGRYLTDSKRVVCGVTWKLPPHSRLPP